MLRRIAVLVLSSAATLTACARTPQPVPLTSEPADLQALEGKWAGEYHSYEASRRSGTLYLRLEAGQDTVHGDILMHVAGREMVDAMPVYDPWEHVHESQLKKVTFVRAADGTVLGELARSHDPVCGCEMRTIFTGRIRNNLLEGTYTSEHINGTDRTTGRWRVMRSLP